MERAAVFAGQLHPFGRATVGVVGSERQHFDIARLRPGGEHVLDYRVLADGFAPFDEVVGLPTRAAFLATRVAGVPRRQVRRQAFLLGFGVQECDSLGSGF